MITKVVTADTPKLSNKGWSLLSPVLTSQSSRCWGNYQGSLQLEGAEDGSPGLPPLPLPPGIGNGRFLCSRTPGEGPGDRREAGARGCGLMSWVWSWSTKRAFLNLSFLICKMDVIVSAFPCRTVMIKRGLCKLGIICEISRALFLQLLLGFLFSASYFS